MTANVEKILEELRVEFGATSDKELAEHLGVHKSTISTWKRRGAVPVEHLSILNKSSGPTMTSSPGAWSTWHWHAFGFALMRFSFAVQPLVQKRDYKDLVAVFLGSSAFFQLMGRMEGNLNSVRMKGEYSLETTFAMAVHDYLSDFENCVEQDRLILSQHGFDLNR